MRSALLKLLLFTLLFSEAHSQFYRDSTKRFTYENAFPEKIMLKVFDDTLLHDVENYNPAYEQKLTPLFPGNLGSPVLPSVFKAQRKNTFTYDNDVFHPYYFTSENENIFINKARYSEVKYARGAKKEQLFHLRHVQKIFQNWIAGVHYRSIASPGIYNRQFTQHKNFKAFTFYQTPDHRYTLHAGYYYNKISAEENGGVTNDSVLMSAGGIDRKTLPVNLTDASVFKRSHHYELNQKLVLPCNRDTSGSDLRSSVFSISHSSSFEKKYSIYQSATIDKGFYEFAYYDTVSTFDSLIYRHYVNDLSLAFGFPASEKLFISIEAGAEHELFKLSQREIRNEYDAVSGFGKAEIRAEPFLFSGKYKRVLSGDAKETAGIYSSVSYSKKNIAADLFFSNEKLFPFIKQQIFHSNHFTWFNIYLYPEYTRLKLNGDFFDGGFILSAEHLQLKNHVYFDSASYPSQYYGTISATKFRLSDKFNLKNWHIEDHLQLSFTDNEDLLPLPLFELSASLAYERSFFKNVLNTRTGITVRYNTSFYAPAYMPATGVFYLQKEKETGNYPYLDFFFNFRIKSARFFIKMEHLNSGWLDENYFMVPHYPLNGRNFKYGFIWQFFD